MCTTWRVNHLVEVNESVGIGTEPGQQSAPHNQIVPRVGLGGVNWQCHYPYLPSKKRQVIQKQIYWIRILAFVENFISTLTKVSIEYCGHVPMFLFILNFELKLRTWYLYYNKKYFFCNCFFIFFYPIFNLQFRFLFLYICLQSVFSR